MLTNLPFSIRVILSLLFVWLLAFGCTTGWKFECRITSGPGPKTAFLVANDREIEMVNPMAGLVLQQSSSVLNLAPMTSVPGMSPVKHVFGRPSPMSHIVFTQTGRLGSLEITDKDKQKSVYKCTADLSELTEGIFKRKRDF